MYIIRYIHDRNLFISKSPRTMFEKKIVESVGLYMQQDKFDRISRPVLVQKTVKVFSELFLVKSSFYIHDGIIYKFHFRTQIDYNIWGTVDIDLLLTVILDNLILYIPVYYIMSSKTQTGGSTMKRKTLMDRQGNFILICCILVVYIYNKIIINYDLSSTFIHSSIYIAETTVADPAAHAKKQVSELDKTAKRSLAKRKFVTEQLEKN